MPDISKCAGGDCPLKDGCYRYTADNSYWQSWFSTPPWDGDDCEYYWPNDKDNGKTSA